MKIGLVTPGGFDRSGTERVIPVFLWLVERLARQHEVHVYTLYQRPEPEEFSLLGATVHNVGYGRRRGRLSGIAQTVRVLLAEHRRAAFDVLHGLWATESGLSAALAGRRARIPTVVTVAGGELVALPKIGYGGQQTWKTRSMIDLTLRLANEVTCASQSVLRLARTRRPDARLLPLGVDTRRFVAQPPLEPGPPWRLLHVASLNRVKDQPTLLRAFQEIRAQEPAVHLDILGDDTLNGEIQRLAASLDLADSVTFHGIQPSETVAAFLRQAHLLLHSSRHEVGPLVLLEAAACGVPTVGTAVGMIADLAPGCAVAVPVGEPNALAESTLALLRDNTGRIALGQRARNYACTHDADWTAAQFAAIYEAMTQRGLRRLAVS